MRSLFCVPLLTGILSAQLPSDGVVVLEALHAGPVVSLPRFVLVDALGRGQCGVTGYFAFPTDPVAISTDGADNGHFWFTSSPAFDGAVQGVWRADVGRLAHVEQINGPLAGVVAPARLAVGATKIATVRLDELWIAPKDLGGSVPVASLPGALDVAVREPLVYVLTNDSFQASLVEWDLVLGTLRTVTTRPDATCLALSPDGSTLAIGLPGGGVERIDAASGGSLGTVTSALGPIVAVDFTTQGTLVYTDGLTVLGELSPTPLYVSGLATIRDLVVVTLPAASIVPFGDGCDSSFGIDWAAASNPTLGNAAFALGLRGGEAGGVGLLVFGASRAVSSVHAVPLPIDLGPLGAPGCRILVDPVLLSLHALDGAGSVDVPVPIPNAPVLIGNEFAAQWAVPDATANVLGFTTSRGVAFVVGL